MKIKSKMNRIILYVCLVFIPTFILALMVWEREEELIREENEKKALEMLYIHKKQIDSLIGETKAKIETMAIFLNKVESKNEMKDLLTKIYKEEPRFSGLYIVDVNGYFQVGTRWYDPTFSINHRPYFQDAVNLKKTAISEAFIGRFSNHYIITLCTPILDDTGSVTNLLVATLRVDYLKNIMNVLSPELYIQVKDVDEKIIFESGAEPLTKNISTIQEDLHELPWSLEAKLIPVNIHELQKSVFLYCFIIFVFFNIIFILIQYYLLHRQAKLERIKAEAQKLELVGTLAASTAHEIRNPLTGISGFLQLLKEKYKSKEDQQYFSIIEKEVKRIEEIASEFLLLGKPLAHNHKPFNLVEILKEVTPIIESECELSNIKLHFDLLDNNEIWINCTKDHIKQVIFNISKNAIDAMENGGALHISLYTNNQYAIMTFKDTGKGIPSQYLSKIFEPFFTLKDYGTGLGLPICKRITEMYNGNIEIESEINKGTCVTITLPIIRKPQPFDIHLS